MKKLNKPQNQLQEVLYFLIKRIKIDRRQMMLSCGVLNLPEQIRRLRMNHNLKIDTTDISTVNKFGRDVKYCHYSIENKKQAANLYRDIQEEHELLNAK